MHSVRVNCIIIIVIVLWSSAFVGIRFGLGGYSPGALAFLRFLVASLCMIIIYLSSGIKKRVLWKDRLQLIFAGMAGIGVYNICLNYGELSVSAGIASFVVGLMPVITVVLSQIIFREKLASGVWYGICISVLGLALLAIGEHTVVGMQQGILAILISALMGAILTIIQKQFAAIYHPVAVIAWIIWGGTLLLSIFLPEMWQQIRVAKLQTTAAVIYMGIFPAALAYLAWGYVLKHVSAVHAALTLYALPIVSTLMGFFFLHEQPSLRSLLGCSITLLGAFIANRAQVRPSFTQEEQFS
jgi:drug/metabolite transporter (DMT)-like permease